MTELEYLQNELINYDRSKVLTVGALEAMIREAIATKVRWDDGLAKIQTDNIDNHEDIH